VNVSSRSSKVLVLSSGQALTALVGIASAAVLTRVFSQHDYASYRQTLLAYTFAVPFVTLGFDRALYYFLPGEEKRSRGILVENLLWLLGGGALLSLFLLVGGNRLLAMRFNNPDLGRLLLLLIPYPLLMLPAASLSACLMARNRTEQVAGFNVASRLLMFLAIVVPCMIWPSPSTAIIGTVLGAAVTTVVALTLMFRACDAGDWPPTWSGIRRQIQFSVPLGLASLVGAVAQSLDQVLVSALCPPAVFAVYVSGAMEIPLIGMITGSVTSVVMVDYARFYREGRTAEIVALIHRAMVKCGLILFPVMVFLLCMAPELMCLLFGKPYEASAIPFRIYLLLLPVRTLTFGAVLQATGFSRLILISAAISLVSEAMLVWCAVHFLGPLLAPTGTVIATYVFTVPYLVFVLRSVLRCSVAVLFPWAELATLMGASCLGIPVLLLLKLVGANWPNLVVVSAAGVAFSVITVGAFLFLGWVRVSSLRSWIRGYLTR
jgi:O-antigen/teichoic acid export membrane protein